MRTIILLRINAVFIIMNIRCSLALKEGWDVDQYCVAALAPWKDTQWMERGMPLGMVYRRKVVPTTASNTGWGALCDGKPSFSHWSKEEDRLHINCLEMLAVCLGIHTFLPDHILVRSDSMKVVSYINHQGGLSSKRLFILVESLLEWAQLNLCTESNTCAGKVEPGSRHAISVQCPLGRVDAPPINDSQNLGDLWQGRGRPLRLRRQLSLPNLFFEGQGCVGPRLAQPPPLCFSPDRPDPTGNQSNQGNRNTGFC